MPTRDADTQTTAHGTLGLQRPDGPPRPESWRRTIAWRPSRPAARRALLARVERLGRIW